MTFTLTPTAAAREALAQSDREAAILVEAVSFAKGVPGVMHPAPQLAESEHAVALLKYAGRFDMKKLHIEPGVRVGRLVVLRRLESVKLSNRPGWMHLWLCKCDCGKETQAEYHQLRNVRKQSCGCWRKELTQALHITLIKHGDASKAKRKPEYRAWCSIIARCFNKNNPAYSHYGGRGISVCAQWRHSFETFLADVGSRPSGAVRYSLDRFPDNNGNYEPGNVRWATPEQQNRNKRNNRLLTVGVETMCIVDWCKRTGIDQSTFHRRLKAGLSVEEAATKKSTPSQECGRASGVARRKKRQGAFPNRMREPMPEDLLALIDFLEDDQC